MQTGYFLPLVLPLHKTRWITCKQFLALEVFVVQSPIKNPIQLSCFLGNLLHASA